MSTAAVISEAVSNEHKPEVKICEHIKDDGIRCGSPAIRGRHFCYHHSRCHAPSHLGTRLYRAPIPECIASLQLTIMQVSQALGSGTITEKTAARLLYAVQLSTNLLKMKEAQQQKNTPEGAPFKPSVGLSGVVPANSTVSPDSSINNSQSPKTNPDDPVTEVSPAMAAALAPHPVEAIDEPEPLSKPITRKEYDHLFEQLMTDAQIRALRPALNDEKGPTAYNRATERLQAHYEALGKLNDAGITEDDPRLAPFRRSKPTHSEVVNADHEVEAGHEIVDAGHDVMEAGRPRPAHPDPQTTPSVSTLTREEAERLARCLITQDEFRALQRIGNAGRDHPDYKAAGRRINDHADALYKLRKAGLVEQYAPPNCHR